MPPTKRTAQSKHESTMSPTASTSRVSPDQHHHLRHAGPNISRTSGGGAPFKPPPASAKASTSENTPNEKSSREKKLTAEVSPPGARISLTKFIYALLIVLLLLVGWYAWGIVVLFERLKEEVGWWGIVVGDPRGTARWEGWGSSRFGFGSEQSADDLEGSLEALANALGVSPVQVASAVKPLVPPASLASIASKLEGTSGSEAVRVLIEDTSRSDRGHKASATGILEDFADTGGEGVS